MPLRPRLPLLGLAMVVASASTLLAGTLTAIAPSGASSGITVQVSGTGLNATAAKNQVLLRAGAVVAEVAASSVTVLDSATGRGRLLFRVPDGLPTGPAVVEVRNLDTGDTSTGRTLQIIALSLPGARRGARGAALDVTLTGTPNTVFVPGATRVVFGPGVTVTAVTVTSDTELVASVAIAADAALGPRAVAFNSSQQMAVLSGAFDVAEEAPPTNHAPTANPGGPYAARVGQDVAFTGAASNDPDGDPLTYAWNFGDGASAAGLSPTHTFSRSDTFTVTLTVNDGKGGSHTASTSAVITETEPTNRPPIAEAGGPYAAMVNDPVVLNGTGSTDPDNDPLTYLWTFGDGVSGSGKAFTRGWTQDGTFTVTLTVSDGKGGSSSDTATVVITRPNRAPVVDAGPDLVVTLPDALPILGVVTDDGLPGEGATIAWSRVSGPADVTFTPANAAVTSASFPVAGAYVLRLTANDGEKSAADDLTVTVRTPGDYTPPFVRLNAPREALPGTRFAVTADAVDNVAVAAVRFEVDGAAPSEDAAPPYEREIEVPALATPGQEIAVRATARDSSGNTAGAQATTVVGVVPDSESPFVTLFAPAQAAPGVSIRFVATATDNVGVARVVFLVDGAEAGSDSTPPYEAIVTVPTGAAVGSRLAVVARAADFNNNLAESFAATAVVGAADEEPPTVALTAPAQVVAGAAFDVSATVHDNVGVAGVTFFVSGVPMANDEVPPYQARLSARADAVPGSMLPVVATAVDFANLMSSDGRSVRVTPAPALPRGVVTGEVYDDTTGLPLAGATVDLAGTDERGMPFAVSAPSDWRGRYVLRAPAGVARLRITKSGWTRVDRLVTLGLNAAVEAFDARLTPLKAAEAEVSPTLGGTLAQGGAQVVVPAGALASPQAMRVQSVSPQGLEGLLPYGWSPVAVVDVLPHGVELAGGATLRAPPRTAFVANASLVLAWWDESAARWRAVSATAVGADTKTLEGLVTRAAQFAWLRPDIVPSAPPLPAPGAPVEGVTEPVLPGDLTTFIDPQPQVLFYQPGVRSDVLGSITAIGPLSSGARLWARVSERYSFLNGTEATTDPFVEDLVFYQGDIETTLAANYPVTPSLSFEAIALDAGVITLELYVPAGAPAVALADVAGTVVQASTGESLVIPPGAVNEGTPFALSGLDAASLGSALSEGLTLEHAVLVEFVGALEVPATLKVPTSLTDASRVLLVKLETLGGATRLILVALAHVESGQLVSAVLLDGQPTGLPGVREAGRYAFVQVADPVGFAAGAVLGTGGAPLAGALVTSDSLSVASRSLPSGAYFAAARAGGVAFTARNLVTGDAATAGTTLIARQIEPLTLTLVAQPPHVVSISPAAGAVNVPLSTPVVVVFSEPIDPATVGGANAGNLLLTGPDGAPIVGTIDVTHGNTWVTLRPTEPLAPNAAYTFTVAAAVTDAAGTPLGAPTTVHFTSLDTEPPPMPPAGSITAGIPRPDGTIVVAGTQGTAGAHDTVVVVNLGTGEKTPALVEPNGGFSVVVRAGLADRFEIRLGDPAGNETVVPLTELSQVNPNGSVSKVIGPDGGTVQAPDGAAAIIAPDTFPDGAVVTVKGIAPADFPVQLSDAEQEYFRLDGGVEIDFGGATPTRNIDLSIPARGDEVVDDQWIVTQVVELDGERLLSVADTARYKLGRVITSSPPCPGVAARAQYGFLNSKQSVGINYALMHKTGYSPVTMKIQPSLLPLPFAPFMIVLPIPQLQARAPICYPSLSGRVSVVPNGQRIRIEGDQLQMADRQVIVKNAARGSTQYFPRFIGEYGLETTGTTSDSYQVVAQGPQGNQVATGLRIASAVPGTVKILPDVDRITIPVQHFVVTNKTTGREKTYDFDVVPFIVAVNGGPDDSLEVTVVNAAGSARTVPFTFLQQESGNLRLKVVPATIDPPSAGRTAVMLSGQDVSGRVENGGIDMTFDGSPTGPYELTVVYADGKYETTKIPSFRITVSNPRTGRVIRTIDGMSPPRDEPVDLGTITDDTTPPMIIGGPARLHSFDPRGVISFTFSEAMDAESLKSYFVVRDSHNTQVRGDVRISSGNRVATFVPTDALRVGEEYTLTLLGNDELARTLEPTLSGGDRPGVRDYSGLNVLPTTRLTLKTFQPHVVSNVFAAARLKDIAIGRKRIDDDLRTTLFVTTGSTGAGKLIAINMSDPVHPGAPVMPPYDPSETRQRIALVPDATIPLRSGGTFRGDLAVTTTFNTIYSFLSFYDVTNPDAPVHLSNKLLTVNPDWLTAFNRKGTYRVFGMAKGVAALKTTSGVAAYAATELVGMLAGDAGNNIPERGSTDRVLEGIYSGDYTDVAAYGEMLVAVSKDPPQLDVFTPDLGLAVSFPLNCVPRRVRVAEQVPIDRDSDGFIAPDEFLDLAVVGCEGGVLLVDLRDPDAMAVVSRFEMPGVVREVDFDPQKVRVFAGGDAGGADSGGAVFMLDASRLGGNDPEFDAGDDPRDYRQVWKQLLPGGVNGLRVDTDRGLLYVTTGTTLQTYSLYEQCCDLAVDMKARPRETVVSYREDLLQKEKDALKAGISKALTEAEALCGIDRASLSMLEQGSGACVWREDPARDCAENYQPGISDHDYEVFFPLGTSSAASSCVVKQLTNTFIDEETGEPRPIELPTSGTMSFEDISFFPMSREEFEAARLNILPPASSGGSDVTGDLGLGRQQLLLKWLLEGEYVEIPGLGLTATPLEMILTRLREETGIPRLEGYEWALLQEFALTKGQVYVRVKGASETESSFHKRYVKQLHDTAKAGIRATLARLVATSGGNMLALRVTREEYRRSACLAVTPLEEPNDWREKACDSFEEYVASVAARSIQQRWRLDAFSPGEVTDLIYRFFKVKADKETLRDDADADKFTADAHRFIQRVKALTGPVYEDEIGRDPDQAQRRSNRDRAIQKTTEALSHGKLHAVPHVSNTGFRTAPNIRVTGFHTPASGTKVQLNEVFRDLRGGDHLYLDWSTNESGTTVKVFEISDIHQNENQGRPGVVAFTVDLPDHSVEEGDRQNNYGGFFYYTLNVDSPAPPATASRVPLPLDDPAVLDRDPTCEEGPAIRVTQFFVIDGVEVPADTAVLGLRETAVLRFRIENLSNVPVRDVAVCSTLAQICESLGTIGINQVEIHNLEFRVPDDGIVADVLSSVIGPDIGVISAPVLRLVASCEAWTVGPPYPDPNPVGEKSTVQRGGKTLRYFRVTNRRNGEPFVGYEVTAEVRGWNDGLWTYDFLTDEDGLIVEPGATPLGDSTSEEAALAVVLPEGAPDGTPFEITVAKVNGEEPRCGDKAKTTVTIKDRTRSRSLSGGWTKEGSVGYDFGAVGVNTKLARYGGQALQKTEKVTAAGTEPASISYKVMTKDTAGGGLKFSLFNFKEDGLFSIQAKASISAGTTRIDSTDYTWTFAYPMSPDAECALVRLVLGDILNEHPIAGFAWEAARGWGCGSNTEQYLTGRGNGVAREASAGGTVGLTLKMPVGVSREFTVKFGVDAGSEVAFGTGVHATYPPGASGGNWRKMQHSFNLRGKVDLSAGLSATVDTNDEDAAQNEKLTTALDYTGRSKTAHQIDVDFEYDRDHPDFSWFDRPTRIGMKYEGESKSGWNIKFDVPNPFAPTPEEPTPSLTYYITRKEDIEKAVKADEDHPGRTFPTLQQIRDIDAGVQVAAQYLDITSPVVNKNVELYRRFTSDMVLDYAQTERNTHAVKFSLLKELLNAIRLKFEGAVPSEEIAIDLSTDYPVEIGSSVYGHLYALEKYDRTLFPDPSTALVEILRTLLDAFLGRLSGQYSDKAATLNPGNPSLTLKSDRTATITFNGTHETEPIPLTLFSWSYVPREDIQRELRMPPATSFGPAGKPHYGVGGFHQLGPVNRHLASPARLVIDYRDDEVQGFDEGSLAIYAWSDEDSDWEFVGGVLDTVNNTVTADIDVLRLYTLGPGMPARTPTITYTDDGFGGTGEQMTQSFTVHVSGLRLNSGGSVPDGTLFTVRSTRPTGDETLYGEILTADAAPDREGVQVVSQGGEVVFTVRYPAPDEDYAPAEVLAYSTMGTASGNAVLTKQ